MVSEDRSDRTGDLLNVMATYLPPPEGTNEDEWASWVEFTELDSEIAGCLVSLRDGGRVRTDQVSAWRRELETREDWPKNWPTRVSALLEACDLLG
jgi:hypothetical protein